MDALKAEGNAHFQSSEFAAADACYVRALLMLGASDLAPASDSSNNNNNGAAAVAVDRSVLHANRSAALMMLGRLPGALDEAELACRLRPDWAKPLFRRAQAFEGLFRLGEAVKMYRAALQLDKGSKQAADKIAELTPKAKEEEDKPRAVRVAEHVKRTGSVANCPVSCALSEFDVVMDVGEGNYTTVHQATYVATGEVVALKIVDKKKAERLSLRHGNLRAELRMERRLLTKLDHPGVVRLLHYFQDASNIYFVEEFCNGKEIWSRLKIRPPPQLNCEWPTRASNLWGLCGIRPSLCRFYLAQVVNVMAYLESQGIVHRDLKPENLMISLGPNQEERLVLIDFGTARDTLDVWFPSPAEEDEILPRRTSSSGSAGARAVLGSHFVGTPEFMSPEAVHGQPASHTSDLWSMGCTAFQMMTGRTPFKGASDYLTFLKAEAGQFYVPEYFTPEQKDLIRGLLRVLPQDRFPSAAQLKAHPYFAGEIDFPALEQPGFPAPGLVPPPPTPAEALVEELGTQVWILAEARGEGPLGQRDDLVRQKAEMVVGAALTARAGGEEEEAQAREELNRALDTVPQGHALFRGWLEQRSLTSTPTVLARLFPDPTSRQFSRVQGRGFVGLTFQEESTWADPYVVVCVSSSPATQQHDVDALVAKVNRFQPRLVMVSGFSTDQFTWFRELDPTVPVAPAPSPMGKEEYYSLWISGILYLFLNCEAFDEEQARWFERELLQGKFNARYVVVSCTKAWFVGKTASSLQEAVEAPDEPGLMPRVWRKRFLSDMQNSGVHVVLLHGAAAAEDSARRFPGTLKKTTDLGMKCMQLDVRAFPSQVRVVRVLTERAMSDLYRVDELPEAFFLENDDRPRPPARGGDW